MTRLLHISASPRGEASESLGLATAFLDTYRQANPGVDVEPSGEGVAAWAAAKATFARFDDADRYLFSVPMWNSGVPYVLKQFIDVVSQPGMVFGFDLVTGYEGLLTGKKAAVIYTGAVWGDDRGAEFGSDFQKPFFEGWLRWAGIDDITSVRFQPNLAAADVDLARKKAHAAVLDVAGSF